MRTLREINNLLPRTVLYKHVIKCEIFSAPPSPVKISNLPATKTPAPPPPGNRMVAPLHAELSYLNFTHLKLCLASASHNFQVGGNYSYCVYFETTHLQICMFNLFKPDFTLSSSSTTSRELLSQFSTCSE